MTSSVANRLNPAKKRKSSGLDWEARMCPHSTKNPPLTIPENDKTCDSDTTFTGKFKFEQHIARFHLKHENKPFQCQEEGCTAPIKGFATSTDLKRHMGSAHKQGQEYSCPDEECDYQSTTRVDNLKQHLDRVHDISVNIKDIKARKVIYDNGYFYLHQGDEEEPTPLSKDDNLGETKECLLCPKMGDDFVEVPRKSQSRHFIEVHLGTEMSSEVEGNILDAIKEDRDIDPSKISVSDKKYFSENSALLEKLLDTCPKLQSGNRVIMKTTQAPWHKYMNHHCPIEDKNAPVEIGNFGNRVTTSVQDENIPIREAVSTPVQEGTDTDEESGHPNESKIRCDECSKQKGRDIMIGINFTMQHYERKHENIGEI